MSYKYLKIIVFACFITTLTLKTAFAGNPISNKKMELTKETQCLLNYLHSLKNSNNILFGHHLSNVERRTGSDWSKAWDPSYSDVYEVTGSMPAVFSFDFGRGIHTATEHCKAIYSWGGIITFSWHAKNPVTGGGFRDQDGNAMGQLYKAGTQANKIWTEQLDEIAKEFNNLEYKGVKIPVIFRPFHEHTGSWFWWGHGHCTAQEFVKAWHYTIDYLREKGVNNMLVAYSPSKPSLNEQNTAYTLDTYPGDEYVDIIGFDQYDLNHLDLVSDARFVVEMAERHGKVAAITEFGNRKGINEETIADWFTKNLEPLHNDPVACKVAYALTWMNRKKNYWTPLKKDKQYDDFLKYITKDYSLLLKDIENVYTFQN